MPCGRDPSVRQGTLTLLLKGGEFAMHMKFEILKQPDIVAALADHVPRVKRKYLWKFVFDEQYPAPDCSIQRDAGLLNAACITE
jgi:hypothetical protein